MRKLRVSAELTLPGDEAVTQTYVIFGKRGSGKSNTAVVMAEEMQRAGAPVVVLDPLSAWWGLKSSFDGQGAGLPFYVFGGPHGDLPLQPDKGELMARTFIEHRIPMILDMKGWLGTERAKFVTAFALYLLGHNDRVPSHVFLEEADAFIPQRPNKGEEHMLGAMDRLVRWGRQEGLGVTAVTQRSAKINKDVTTQAETLIAHRTTGPQDRAAIDDWIRYHAGEERRQEVLTTLPTLPDGTAWVWSPEWLEILKQVKFRRRETFDSASTPKLGERRVEPKALAQVDIDRLNAQLADTIEKAKENDPSELKRRIRELEAQKKRLEGENDILLESREPEVRVQTIYKVPPDLHNLITTANAKFAVLQEAIVEFGAAWGQLIHARNAPPKWDGQEPTKQDPITREPENERTIPSPRLPSVAWVSAPREAPPSGPPGSVSKTGRAILSVLAQFESRSRKQIAMISGYSPTSGGFGQALAELRKLGLMQVEGGNYAITAAGREALGDAYEPLPTGQALLRYWLEKVNTTEAKLLESLVTQGPASRAELADRTAYSPTSGGYGQALAKLRALDLMEGNAGELRASSELMEAIA